MAAETTGPTRNDFLVSAWNEYVEEARHLGVDVEAGFGTAEDFTLFLLNSYELAELADQEYYREAMFELVRVGWSGFEAAYK